MPKLFNPLRVMKIYEPRCDLCESTRVYYRYPAWKIVYCDVADGGPRDYFLVCKECHEIIQTGYSAGHFKLMRRALRIPLYVVKEIVYDDDHHARRREIRRLQRDIANQHDHFWVSRKGEFTPFG